MIFTGYSGAGKTLIAELIFKMEHLICKCVTSTTRKPRLGEKNGIDYFFLTKEKFLFEEKNQKFIETNSYLKELGLPNFLYGTPKAFVEENRYKKPLFFNVDPNGALALKDYFGDDCVTFFIDVEDIDVLKRRLISRKSTEDDEEIQARLKLFDIQFNKRDLFDYRFVNKEGLKNAKNLAKKILKLSLN